MDKEFWVEIYKNQYEIPAGYTLAGLTREIFSYLGSTDPELRDEIAYTFFANWLKQERYPAAQIREYVLELLGNLERGIGETESDSVFLRTFSILFLAEIIHNDNKKTLLERSDIEAVLDKCLWYIGAERDPRGFIPVKGWAHALAHTADLMLVLAKNKNLEEAGLTKILNAISDRILQPTRHVYIHGEDERLAAAILEILRRDLIPLETVKAWSKSLVERDWNGAYTDEDKNPAYQNTRNLLRSVYLELQKQEKDLPHREELQIFFLNALSNLKPY